jgi:hypothetical protein
MTTIEELLEKMFSVRSVQSGYKEGNWGYQVSWEVVGKQFRAGVGEGRTRSLEV